MNLITLSKYTIFFPFSLFISILNRNRKSKIKRNYLKEKTEKKITEHHGTILFNIIGSYYLGFSITTCLKTPAGIRDFTSWLPSDAVPSRAINNCKPVAERQ